MENRTTYKLDSCELDIFETHQDATKVSLVFGALVLTTMLKGKKVMHLFDKPVIRLFARRICDSSS